MSLRGATVNAGVLNGGELIARGNVVLAGQVTTLADSRLRVESGGAFGAPSTLTLAQGFTNEGTLELIDAAVSDISVNVTQSEGISETYRQTLKATEGILA